MSAPVFLGAVHELAPLKAGDTYVLAGPEGHHAAIVQRRKVGERIDIVDGAGRRLHTTITEVRGPELVVHIDASGRDLEPKVRITIVQALVKNGAEDSVATLTEVGVDQIVPWQAERSIAKWQGERGRRSHQKWQVAATEATKQSRRAVVPEVSGVVQNRELLDKISEARDRGALVLVAHESAHEMVDAVITSHPSAEIWCVIGPEGGISDSELAQFAAAGAHAVSLGTHILRAVTAGTVATVLIRSVTEQ